MHCCLLWHLAICVHVLFFRTFVIERGLLEENRVQMKRWNDPVHSLLNACASGEYGVPADQEQAALLRQVRAHLREVLGLDGDDLRRRGGRLSCHFLLGQSASQGQSWWWKSSYDFLRILVIWCSENILSLTLNCHWKVGIKYRQSMGEMIFLVLILF